MVMEAELLSLQCVFRLPWLKQNLIIITQSYNNPDFKSINFTILAHISREQECPQACSIVEIIRFLRPVKLAS